MNCLSNNFGRYSFWEWYIPQTQTQFIFLLKGVWSYRFFVDPCPTASPWLLSNLFPREYLNNSASLSKPRNLQKEDSPCPLRRRWFCLMMNNKLHLVEDTLNPALNAPLVSTIIPRGYFAPPASLWFSFPLYPALRGTWQAFPPARWIASAEK